MNSTRWFVRLAQLLPCAGCLVASIAVAQYGPVGEEFQASPTSKVNQINPSIARNPARGEFVVVWRGTLPGAISAQRYSSAGVPVGSEIQVNNSSQESYLSPSVGMRSDGGFVVTWARGAGTGYGKAVLAQRFNGNGARVGQELQIATADQPAAPQIAMAPTGEFVIQWKAYATPGRIVARRFSSSGAARGQQFVVADVAGVHGVAMNPGRGFISVWADVDNSGSGILGRRFNSLGVGLGSAFTVSANTSLSQRYPSVAMQPDGQFVVVWEGNRPEEPPGHGVSQIEGRRYSSTGQALDGSFVVHVTDYEQSDAVVSADAAGNWVVAWTEVHESPYLDVMAKFYDSAGIANPEPIQFNQQDEYRQWNPSLAGGPAGDFVAVWNSLNQVDEGVEGVFGRRHLFQITPREVGAPSGPVHAFVPIGILAALIGRRRHPQDWALRVQLS